MTAFAAQLTDSSQPFDGRGATAVMRPRLLRYEHRWNVSYLGGE
jgi:hypothetical protein